MVNDHKLISSDPKSIPIIVKIINFHHLNVVQMTQKVQHILRDFYMHSWSMHNISKCMAIYTLNQVTHESKFKPELSFTKIIILKYKKQMTHLIQRIFWGFILSSKEYKNLKLKSA